ncbi:MAG: response regulator transcription factor [Clostridia bacterium]|nr:response regulator transcription factor [Clostridia bacterium]
MEKILIVDDEEKIVEVLCEYAKFNGFLTDTASDGYEAVEKVMTEDYDCILMDIMMPNLNGFEAVKQIKNIKNIPIIMISAKGEESDKLNSFELGVDDYIVKPFSPKEVIARIKAVLKRSCSYVDKLKFDMLEIDTEGRIVTVDGEEKTLTNKEYNLLLLLVKNKDIVLTRDKILNQVWGYDYYGDGRTVDTHIKMLRADLGEKVSTKIKTVHGVGYKFESK